MIAEEFEAALSTARDITRIQIDIVAADRFRWTLYEDDREVYCDEGDRQEIAAMLTASEMLVNTMLGVPPGRVCLHARPITSLN